MRAHAVGRDAALEGEAIAGGERHICMTRTGGEALANHHASLGPKVRVLHAGNTPDDVAVVARWLVDEAELVGVVPNVSARSSYGPSADGVTGTAGGADRADVLTGPWPRDAAEGGEETRLRNDRFRSG